MAQVETPFGPVTLQSPLLANVASVQLRLAKLRHEIAVARVKMLRARRRKSHWVKPWVNRRSEHGMYHRLMVELREENPADFCEFLRCCKVFWFLTPKYFRFKYINYMETLD